MQPVLAISRLLLWISDKTTKILMDLESQQSLLDAKKLLLHPNSVVLNQEQFCPLVDVYQCPKTLFVVPAQAKCYWHLEGNRMFNPTNAQDSPHNREFGGPKFQHCCCWEILHNPLFVSPTLSTGPGKLLRVSWTHGCSPELRWLYSLPYADWRTDLVITKCNLTLHEVQCRHAFLRHSLFSHLVN